MRSFWWTELEDVWAAGVDFNMTSLGGAACLEQSTPAWRLMDTAAGLAASAASLWLGWDCLRREVVESGRGFTPPPISQGRIRLLAALCLVFGIEVGYKFASQSLLFLLFPCHAITMVSLNTLVLSLLILTKLSLSRMWLQLNLQFLQCYVLHDIVALYSLQGWIWLLSSSRPSPLLYRCLLHFTHGPAIAVAIPTYEDLVLPMEKHVYWAQHVLLLSIPVYLIFCEEGNGFRAPTTISWPHACFAFGVWCFYHFVVMQVGKKSSGHKTSVLLLSSQGAALLTLVNVGHMLCPAKTDPFAKLPPSYLIVAIVHQVYL